MGVLSRVFGDLSGFTRRSVIAAAAAGISLLAPYAAVAAEPVTPVEAAAEADGATPRTAPGAVSAQMLAIVAGAEVEDLSQRTESSSTFALPDGTWRADISSGIEWVATGEDPATDEGWERLDVNLIKFTDGTYRPVAHPDALILTGGAAGKVAVVKATDNATGVDVVLSWTGKVPEPIIEGAFARYVDIRPGVDLVIEVTATGYEQYFVVNRPQPAGKPLRLPLEFSSAASTVEVAKDSSVDFVDGDGEVVGHVSDADMWDATEDEPPTV